MTRECHVQFCERPEVKFLRATLLTIAIANARFARKQWGLRKSTAKSRRLFRNESATSRRVRAGAIGGSTAMTRTAFCRKSPRVPRVCWPGSWALGTSDRGGQDKANWRSRTRRPVSGREIFVCTLVFRSAAAGGSRRSIEDRWRASSLTEAFQCTKRRRSRTSISKISVFVRSRAPRRDFLRSTYHSSCAGRIRRGSSAHGNRSRRRFFCAARTCRQPGNTD
jgi:hypothetical protein